MRKATWFAIIIVSFFALYFLNETLSQEGQLKNRIDQLAQQQAERSDFLSVSQRRAERKDKQRDPLIREGTKFKAEIGVFKWKNERLFFLPKKRPEASLQVLENLALERLSADIPKEKKDELKIFTGRKTTQTEAEKLAEKKKLAATLWKVNGIVTEYLDENYLFIESVMRAPNLKTITQ